MGRLLKCWSSLLVVLLTYQITGAYRPVIIMHGIFDGPQGMEDLVSLITDAHPGTKTYNMDGYNDMDSVVNMWEQVNGIRTKMLPIFADATDGVHLICFSQGGLICRGILETTPEHNVRSFISLSSPQGGQFGDTEYLKYLFPTYAKDHIYEFFYTDVGQDVSVANYWKDPHHLDGYYKNNRFLPALDYPTNSTYKKNFLNVQQLVLIGGPDDGVITPWQSSHFAFYDENETVVELKSQRYYTNDTFGLQTLDKQDKLHIHEISGVQHIHWHKNKDVFECCIQPYLD